VRKTSTALALALALAVSTLVLAGCSSSATRLAKKQLEAEVTVDFEVACRNRLVTLSHRANSSINAHPPYIEVCRGTTVTINIEPSNRPTRSIPQSNESDATWLNGTSADGSPIILTVPMNAAVGATFKYTLEVTGVGTIDPGIRIIN
jgi:hypothetical protein